MKINITLDLESDLIEEYEDDDGNTCARLKDQEEIDKVIKEQFKKAVIEAVNDDIRKESSWVWDRNSVIVDTIMENKQEIIEQVISKVSKSIINSKKIKDFKKSLDEDCPF